jgi:hypothetical protein
MNLFKNMFGNKQSNEDPSIYGKELVELRILLKTQQGILSCIRCNKDVRVNLADVEAQIRKNRDIETRYSAGGRTVLIEPDLSQGTVCKNCKGVVCGNCTQEARKRKIEFREELKPLIRRYAVEQVGVLASLNPDKFEEIVNASLEACLSPSDVSTILCLNCKKDLLMGLDHITD